MARGLSSRSLARHRARGPRARRARHAHRTLTAQAPAREHLVDEVVVALRLEEAPAGEQEERHGPERVDVGAGVGVGRVSQALRRHVERRAQDARELRDVARVRVLEFLHEAEVEHLHHVELAAMAAEHEVVRLHVAVHQPAVVRLLQRPQTWRSACTARDTAGVLPSAPGPRATGRRGTPWRSRRCRRGCARSRRSRWCSGARAGCRAAPRARSG